MVDFHCRHGNNSTVMENHLYQYDKLKITTTLEHPKCELLYRENPICYKGWGMHQDTKLFYLINRWYSSLAYIKASIAWPAKLS